VIEGGDHERDFCKSKEKFPSANERSPSWIQGVHVAAVESVRIDYGDEGKD